MTGILNLRDFIERLRRENEIVDIFEPVDPSLEIPEIHRRVVAANGPALFFHNPTQGKFPVVTNLFGSIRRLDLAFANRPEKVVADLVELATAGPSLKKIWEKRRSLGKLLKVRCKSRRRGPVTACEIDDLEALPMLKSWPDDGGHFITLPLVYTEPVDGGPPNLGMYRIHRYDKKTTGLHFQIAKGGGFHYHQAEQAGKNLPVSIFVGGPPAMIMSAIAPLPENVPELMLASLLQGKALGTTRVDDHPHPLVAESEFALVGEARPGERRLEGPFGDHYGYYSLAHEFPVFHCKKIYHRKDAIYPATIVGKPRQEDFYIGDYLQRLLSPIFPLAMPGAKKIWTYGETGFHSLSAAVVHERYYRECMSTAFRILGEGQLALTKFLLITNQDVDVSDIKAVLTCVLERFRPETDLFIFSNLSLDTLDYTGPELNKGSRGIMLGIGEKIRDLPREVTGPLPHGVRKAIPFCPGCLVIEGETTAPAGLNEWPLVILVDDAEKVTRSNMAFLWTVFTRFEPAADIHTREATVHRHHLSYSGPVLIDARMKDSYPPEVICDEATANKVDDRWNRYFPDGMEMGDSNAL